MDRATKLIVVCWAVAALAFQLWLLRPSWPALPLYGAVAFVGAALLVAAERRAVAGVLIFTCVFPALIRIAHGRYNGYFSVLWTAPMLGAIVSDALRTPWHVPPRWRAPMACWALVIVSGSLVVMWRESDLYPALPFREQAAGPIFAWQWTIDVALSAALGMLWFDWLFGAPRLAAPWIAVPLSMSVAALCVVALYQGTVNIWFVNETQYGNMGRAAGTTYDSNVSAVIAAMWLGALPLLAERLDRFRVAAIAAGSVLIWMAVWATGSRTGFAVAVLSTACTVAVLAAEARKRRRLAPAAMAAVVLIAAAAAFAVGTSDVVSGPFKRFATMLPEVSPAGFGRLGRELWRRDGYGPVADAMIARYPWFGVGLGSFHALMGDFATAVPETLVPDNAQNWYRHQLAELGVVGSLGWIVWVALFAVVLLRFRHGESRTALPLRGAVAGFGLISLVGVPGQNVSVAIVFWTLAFWYATETPAPPAVERVPRWQWLAVAAVVVVFAYGSAMAAVTALRPAFRARDASHPYAYGFHAPEPDGFRWARGKAVAVVEAQGPSLRIELNLRHPGMELLPVHATLRVDGRTLADEEIVNGETIVREIAVTPQRWVAIESSVNRVVRPRDFGIADDRQLGVLIRWEFRAAPAQTGYRREAAS